jgi:hypothetical protein
VRRRAILLVAEGERPRPRRSHRRGRRLHDATHRDALNEHVVIVIPFAGWAGGRRAFEDQLGQGLDPIYSTQSAKVLALGDRRHSPSK